MADEDRPVGNEAKPDNRARRANKSVRTADLLEKLRRLHDTHLVPSDQLEVIQKLGEGGFATVDLCWYSQPSGQRTQVAVKRVRPDALRHTTQLKLFANESEILVKLKHENVVQLIGLGSTDPSTDEALRDTFFLVEELVNGGSLRLVVLHQMIQAPEPLYRIRDAVRWGLEVSRALQYLHSCSPAVVHRDLKPDNVLLTNVDPALAHVKLADFGLSVMVPNKHVQAEARTSEPVVRSAQREARWRRSMAPRSNSSLTGAAAMLHMIESASLAAAYEAGGQSMQASPVSASGNTMGSPSDGAAQAGGSVSGAPNSRARNYLVHTGSRAGNQPGMYSRNSLAQGGPGSRTGLYSGAGGMTSRSSVGTRVGPVSGLLSRIGLGLGSGSGRPLECPSGVMFDLTSMTGSLLYMAPEVFKGEPYNTKADTFSLAILLYELLHQRLIMASLIAQQMEDGHSFENEILEFTRCVSAGFRPPIESWLPDYVQQLITSCWAQSPTDRPSMQHVVAVLERFLASPELEAIDKARQPRPCCTVC